MPERLNICCLFENAPLKRRSVFVQLFGVDHSWMGQLASFMILNIDNGTMMEGPWPPSDSILEQSLNGRLLFAYSNWASGAHRFRSSISLAEADGRAVYTMSFPVALLQQSSFDNLEQRFLRIYEAVGSIGNANILIGPELEVQPTQSETESISAAFDPASLVIWIIAQEKKLPEHGSLFEIARKDKGRVLLRHPEAAPRVGLSTM